MTSASSAPASRGASAASIAAGGTGVDAPRGEAFAWFRKYFAPTPGRAREAAWVALAAVTSVAVLLSFGMANGTAALLVMNSLGPSAVSNWRSLPRRLAFVVVPALIVLPVGGFLLQLPPLLVPTLFATITALLYFHPETRYGFDSLAALLILLNPIYDGALDPRRFAASAGATAAEAAVAAIVATVFFEFARPGGIRLRLSNSLAGGFRDDRARLASAAARARAGQPTDASADLPRPTAIPLLDMLRQEGIADSEERVLVLLTSTCERSGSFVATLETIAGGGPIRMSPGVAAAADALVAGLDRALDGFVEAAGHWRSDEPLSPRPDDPWPDLQALRGDLEREQQLAIEARSAGHPTDGAPSERERERRAAWIAALGGLAQVLHTSPADLRALVHDDPRDLLDVPEIAAPTESLDPIPLRYALQVALTMMICFHLGLATHLPAPITFLWSPLMVAQTSFGATVRKARLRAVGVIAGGLLSLALVIGFMPATDDLALWLVALFAVLFACQYAALGEPRWWYVGYQAAVTVVVLTVGEGPVVSVDGVLWRAWGLVLSLAVLFAVFRLLPPDTAARQLVRRWRDLGRILARFLPGPGEPLPDMAELVRTRLRVGRIGADLLRLADELRVEGDQEIDPTAAIEAGGLAMRSTYRAGLVARARVLAPPDGSPDDPTVLAADADAAAAAHARSVRDVVETATRRADRFGWDTKAPRDDEGREDPLATTALPDLGAAVEDLSRRLEKRGVREMAGRTAGQATEIVSSIENLRRLSVLLPRLEEALGRALGSRATALLAVLVLFSGCASMIPPLSPLRAIDPESLAPKQANRTWEPEPGVVPTPAPSPTTESSEPRASRSTRTDAAASPDAPRARDAGADTTSPARGEAGSGTSIGPLDLPELIDLGLRESPSTRAAWEASRGAAARVGRSLEPYYPTLRTSARLAPNERLLFQDTPQTLIAHQRAWEPQVSLAYTLLDFGRRARTAEVARQRLTAANFSFNRELQRVAFEVSHAYFLLDAAIALEQAATENVELARRVREAATRRLDVGLGTRPDVLLAEQVETRALYDRESAAAGIRAAEAQLGRALGREASRVPRVRPLNSQPIPTSLGADVEALLARAVEQRPDLAARQAEVRAANAEVERARAEYMPTIGFAGNYGFDSWDYSLGSTNDIRTNQPTWSTAFRVDWDVFRGFGRANAVREAKAASAQAQAALERERIDATAEVWTAYYDFQAARRKLEYAETLLASAKEAYEGTAKSYENGLADIVALLTAERDLATARATRVRARAELLTSAARLGYTVGLVVPEAEAR